MERSNPIDKLLGISSDPTGVHGQSSIELPEEMRPLYKKDGFFAFESALEVFPLSRSHKSYSLGEWNDENGWISFYQELRPAGIFFAHNVFGDQFLFNEGVHIFDSETAEVSYLAESIESWAERLLGDYQLLTGQPLAHEWQVGNGPIPPPKPARADNAFRSRRSLRTQQSGRNGCDGRHEVTGKSRAPDQESARWSKRYLRGRLK
jgi:hypothetical protein